ncbi:MAG: hypothetical protein CVV27_02830 [Candidatus Melainabacteria bacterium HGW-Melainabacteria-1]|nr:MAG: hypothetical protein CVV27_02830 [Candidatus Melainabacteria bacterium HGW-Melainabacteria-1]
MAVQQGLIKPVDMTIAYQTYLMTKIHAYQCQYVLEAAQGRLLLQDREGDSAEWSSLDMPAPAYQGQWVPFSSEKIALFDRMGQYKGVQDRSRPEIIPSAEGGYVWSGNQAYRLQSLLNPLVPIETVQRGPYDFYLPPDQDTGVFISDRAAGTLMMTDLTLNVTKAQLRLREAGSKKALCLAYDAKGRTCYVTDHQTSDLIVIKPFEQKLDRISTAHGLLGNLVLDLPRKRLLALLADPEQESAVLIYGLEKFDHQGTILIPGKRFSTLDDPCDLMGLAPDGRHLLVMSYTDEPALCTPLLSRIDLQTSQLVKTHTLSSEEKPIGFAFAHQQPKPQAVPDFEDFLADKGILAKPQIIGLIRQIQAIEEDRNKPLLDKDVADAMSHIQGHFSNQELSSVTELSQQAVAQMSQDTFFEWQGRSDMNPEEKQVFVERLAQLKADETVTRTNGVFVLNWLKGLGK